MELFFEEIYKHFAYFYLNKIPDVYF